MMIALPEVGLSTCYLSGLRSRSYCNILQKCLGLRYLPRKVKDYYSVQC